MPSVSGARLALFVGALALLACSAPDDGAAAGAGAGSGGQVSTSGGATASGAGGAAGAAGAGGSFSVAGASSGGGGVSGNSSGGSGTSGTSGTGGVGGAAGIDYDPCPPADTPCTVLPLGDSITHGYLSSDNAGYRSRLFHRVLSNNQSVMFVGGSEDGPDTVDGVAFPKHHEGHAGYEISGDHGILSFTQGVIEVQTPQIVLLMIGTNDIAFNNDPPNAATRLGELLDLILTTDPNLLLIVAQIVPTTDDDMNVTVKNYNDAIPALVQARHDAGQHIALVDMYGAFVENPNYKTEYMADKYHPQDTGYDKVAEVWYAALAPLLN